MNINRLLPLRLLLGCIAFAILGTTGTFAYSAAESSESAGFDAPRKPLYAGSSNGFDKGQRAKANELGVETVPSRRGTHAEEDLLHYKEIEAVGTYKRKPCGPGEHNCAQQLEDAGVQYDLELEDIARQIRDAADHPAAANRRTIAVGRGRAGE